MMLAHGKFLTLEVVFVLRNDRIQNIQDISVEKQEEEEK